MKLELTKEFIIDQNCPTPSCHASTVLPMKDGSVGAAWFGGTNESNDDVDIWFSRRVSGSWSEPVCISADKALPHWNPVLFQKDEKTVVLFFKVGKKIAFWKTYFVESTDHGLTWSAPRELVPNDDAGGRGPVKNKAIRLSSGRVLAPASTEQNHDWRCFVDYSDDELQTWRRSAFIERPTRYRKVVGMIQPSLWESAPGRVHMLMRTDCGFVYRSDSSDFGATWSPAYKTGLFNNNSGLDVARTADGRLFLVSNPVRKNWGERTPLTVVCSDDNGVTWGAGAVLESMPGEYSYPAIVSNGDELLITYTWNRKKICFARMKVNTDKTAGTHLDGEFSAIVHKNTR